MMEEYDTLYALLVSQMLMNRYNFWLVLCFAAVLLLLLCLFRSVLKMVFDKVLKD